MQFVVPFIIMAFAYTKVIKKHKVYSTFPVAQLVLNENIAKSFGYICEVEAEQKVNFSVTSP